MKNWATLNKKWIQDNNLILTDYNNGVWLLENFLTPEVVKRLQDKLYNLSESDWKEAFIKRAMSKYNEKNKKSLNSYEDIVHEIATKQIINLEEFFMGYEDSYNKTFAWDTYEDEEWIAERLSNLFLSTDKNKEITTDRLRSFKRNMPGTSLSSHKDSDKDDSLLYSTVLYINEDFEGGEIYFSDLNFSLKPKEGSLCIFDGFKELTHEVLEIKKGNRYSSTLFIWDKEKRENSQFRNNFR